MRRTFPTLGSTHYSIALRTVRHISCRLPAQSSFHAHYWGETRERERERGEKAGGGGGEEGGELRAHTHTHIHTDVHASTRAHTRARAPTHTHARACSQIQAYRQWEGIPAITLLVTEVVELEFRVRSTDTLPSRAVSSCQPRFIVTSLHWCFKNRSWSKLGI